MSYAKLFKMAFAFSLLLLMAKVNKKSDTAK